MSTPGVLVFCVQLTLFGPATAQYRHPHASTCQILTTRRARFTSCDVTRLLIRRQNLSPCRAANVVFRARKKDWNIIFKVAETVSMERLCTELHICSQFDSSLLSLHSHFRGDGEGHTFLGDLLWRVMLFFCWSKREGQDFKKDNTPKKTPPQSPQFRIHMVSQELLYIYPDIYLVNRRQGQWRQRAKRSRQFVNDVHIINSKLLELGIS